MLPTVSCETHDDVNSLPRYRGWRIPSPCLRPHSSGAVRMGMSGACPTEQHNLAIKTRHARNSTYATLFWMTWSLRIDGDVLLKKTSILECKIAVTVSVFHYVDIWGFRSKWWSNDWQFLGVFLRVWNDFSDWKPNGTSKIRRDVSVRSGIPLRMTQMIMDDTDDCIWHRQHVTQGGSIKRKVS